MIFHCKTDDSNALFSCALPVNLLSYLLEKSAVFLPCRSPQQVIKVLSLLFLRVWAPIYGNSWVWMITCTLVTLYAKTPETDWKYITAGLFRSLETWSQSLVVCPPTKMNYWTGQMKCIPSFALPVSRWIINLSDPLDAWLTVVFIPTTWKH